MNYDYCSNLWTYKMVKGSIKMEIIAREEKTANEIIDIINDKSPIKFKPVKFRFKKKIMLSQPPYQVEQEELSSAEEMREKRKAKLEEMFGGDLIWKIKANKQD